MTDRLDHSAVKSYFNIYGQYTGCLNDSEDQMVVSFGPNVDQNPSPSDPLIKTDRFQDIRVRFSIRGNLNFKFIHSTRIYASWPSRSDGHIIFGMNRRSNMCNCASDTYGRYWSWNSEKPSCLLLVVEDSDGSPSSYPISLRQSFFDSKEEMKEQFGFGGEPVIVTRYRSLSTAHKHIAGIISHFNGPQIVDHRGGLDVGKALELFPVFFDDQRSNQSQKKRSSVPVRDRDRELVSV